MLFNTIDFAIFLPLVFGVYWFVVNRNLRVQNAFLALAGYVFYGWWDWKFLLLLMASSWVDFLVGIRLQHTREVRSRKWILGLGLSFNILLLGMFKYYDFFVSSFAAAFSFFGQEIHPQTLGLVLPVGISFYTFQSMSYSIEVYRRNLQPTNNLITYSAYVGFFPQLVAGPIERASELLPQFYKPRIFDYEKSVNGLKQILWGLFKKTVIADGCAEFANQVFDHNDQYTGASLMLGAVLFSIQIYGDFSGYTDIALGCARLFGFELMRNFNFPYFSRNMGEFWKRWHISLTNWFRNYVYFSLGGNRGGKWKTRRNMLITFLVSGFWHGANWTFVVWGLLNALCYLPYSTNKQSLQTSGKLKQGVSMLLTFLLVTLLWVFFRANSMGQAIQYLTDLLAGLFTTAGYREAYILLFRIGYVFLLLVGVFFVIEWKGRHWNFAIEGLLSGNNRVLRYLFYLLLTVIILLYSGQKQAFIYFQF